MRPLAAPATHRWPKWPNWPGWQLATACCGLLLVVRLPALWPKPAKLLPALAIVALGIAHTLYTTTALANPNAASLPPIDSMAARVLACTTCHGAQGRATPDGYYPRIAGKPAEYLYNQLQNFRQGRRSYPAMANLLTHLSDDYLHEIAVHFAALDLPYAPPAPPSASAATLAHGEKLARHGDSDRRIPACVACHGNALTGLAPAIPGLLGLSRDYLNSQLGAWQTGRRRPHAPDCMAEIARQLTAQDVSALSTWLASQRFPSTATALTQPPPSTPLPMRCGGVPQAAAKATP